MKKLILISIIFIGVFSCVRSTDPGNVHECELPSEISSEMCGGTPIEWNCDWEMAYNEGNVIINRDSTGCITSIVKVGGKYNGHNTIKINAGKEE